MGAPHTATKERAAAGKPAAPALVLLSGLPGTGKTFFSRRLAEKLPFTIIESDAVRKELFPRPSYSPAESARVFRRIHQQIKDSLAKRESVIFDATNLEERHRRTVYSIAGEAGARLIIVEIDAPPELVRKRMQNRTGKTDNLSDADWNVYRRMKNTAQKITLPHFAVNTARDITPVIDKIVTEINR